MVFAGALVAVAAAWWFLADRAREQMFDDARAEATVECERLHGEELCAEWFHGRHEECSQLALEEATNEHAASVNGGDYMVCIIDGPASLQFMRSRR